MDSDLLQSIDPMSKKSKGRVPRCFIGIARVFEHIVLH